MPLKLRIRPEGKLFVSGTGWIKDVGNRPMDVIVSEGMSAEREKRMEAKKHVSEGELDA